MENNLISSPLGLFNLSKDFPLTFVVISIKYTPFMYQSFYFESKIAFATNSFLSGEALQGKGPVSTGEGFHGSTKKKNIKIPKTDQAVPPWPDRAWNVTMQTVRATNTSPYCV